MFPLVTSAVQWVSNATAPVIPDLCEVCRKRPKYIEKGVKHPYCGRTCARMRQLPFPSSNGEFVSSGCRTTGRTAKTSFCGAGTVLCTAYDPQPRAATPKLTEVNPDGSKFEELRSVFLSDWKVNQAIPILEKVYEIRNPSSVVLSYEHYKNGYPDKILARTFHAGQCICDLGTKEPNVCNYKSCGICRIIKSSFREFAFGEQYNVGRLGKGIYVYRDPSLADRYATSCTSSPYRVMIMCNVVVDDSHFVKSDEARKSMFIDSVNAVLPLYVIMYCTSR